MLIAHEEKLQLKHRFPYFEENKKGHQCLMAELDAIKYYLWLCRKTTHYAARS